MGVGRLVDRGLVAKVASRNDKRRRSLAITAKGRRVLTRAEPPVQERLISGLAGLTRAECRQLIKALEVVARSVGPDRAPKLPPMLFEDAGSE